MRVVLGISGASGAAFGVTFLKRCPAEETFVIVSRWGRHLLKSETDLIPADLATHAKKVFANDDMSSPLASGSNSFDAMVVLPCSVATLGKIAHGISDNLLTRTAEVALKERRKLVLCVRETPLSSIALENALKLSREGVIIMPVSPPFYLGPQTLEEMYAQFADKVLGVLGLPTASGWRAAELE